MLKWSYRVTKMQLCVMVILLLLPFYYTSAKAVRQSGVIEARMNQQVTTETSELSDKEDHNIDSSSEKGVMSYLRENTFFLWGWFYALVAAGFEMDDYGWQGATVKKFLDWRLLFIISIALLIACSVWGLHCFAKLKHDRNSNTIESEIILDNDLLFMGRSYKTLLAVLVAYGFVLLSKRSIILIVVLFALLHFEKKRYVRMGGEMTSGIIWSFIKRHVLEFWEQLGVANGLNEMYGEGILEPKNTKRKERSRPLTRSTEGD